MATTTLKQDAQAEADTIDREIAEHGVPDIDETPEDDGPISIAPPGSNGRVTEPGADDPDAGGDENEFGTTLFHRNPSKEEHDRAEELYRELMDEADEMHPQRVIDLLVNHLVDVHHLLTMPAEWPGESTERFRGAPTVDNIARLIARGCRPHIEIGLRDFGSIWRNQKTWTAQGQDIVAKMSGHNDRDQFLLDGKKATIEVDFRRFQALTPRQKVHSIYRAMRRLNKDGVKQRPHFSGYRDEFELFGIMTTKEMAMLHHAMEAGSEREEALRWTIQRDFLDELDANAGIEDDETT